MTRITQLSIMKVKRQHALYCSIPISHIHIRTNFHVRINYVSKANCKNFMLFVHVIFVSGISNFVVINYTVSISSTYCHKLTARDAIFGLRNGNKFY